MANFKIKLMSLSILVALFNTACRKELSNLTICSNEVAVEIEKLLPDSLSTFGDLNVRSVSLLFYPKQGGAQRERKITGKEGRIEIPNERYDILIYTSDFYELDAVFYRGVADVNTAEAYTRKENSQSKLYIAEPDPLFCIFLEDVDIAKEKHRLQNLDMRPLAFAYRFRVYVEGIEFVRSVRATVRGLYSTVFLKSGGHREQEVAQTLIPIEIKGNYIYGDFYTFGMHQNKEVEHHIVLTFVNGKTETVELENLTEKLKAMPRGGEIKISQKITITGNNDDSGFTPGVAGWDDETTVPLPI